MLEYNKRLKGGLCMIYNRIDELIGRTPVLKLSGLPKEWADVYVKLEYFNPGGSVKDRIGKVMIEAAEANGELKAGDIIVEPTSGNTGIGLAMVGAAKGYKVIFCMPDTMTMERRLILQAYGAELVLTDGKLGMKGSIAAAEELSKQDGYVMLSQFDNLNNPRAHRESTALEILADFADGLDAFVAGVGTGGTITGNAQILKERMPDIKIVAVEPKTSAVLSGEAAGPHTIPGIGAGFIASIVDVTLFDDIRKVSNEDAIETTRMMAKTYGTLLGVSSGAAISAAFEVAKELGAGKKVLAIAPDTGERYLSTPVYQSNK